MSITLVITSYNRPQELKDAFASAINQKYINEIIIVDDASTINPIIGMSVNSRVNIVRHDRNRGVSAARNTGLSSAKSDYIAYLDDDDKLLPNAFMPHLGIFEKLSEIDQQKTVVVGAVLVEHGKTIHRCRVPPSSKPGQIWGLDPYLLKTPSQSFFCKTAALYPTKLLRSLNGWDENMRSRVTTELFFRICEKYHVIGIEDSVYIINRDNKLRITNDKLVRKKSFKYLTVKHKNLLKYKNRFKYFLNNHLNNLYTKKSIMQKILAFTKGISLTIIFRISI